MRGQLGGLGAFVWGLVVVGFMLVLGIYVSSQLHTQITTTAGAGSAADNAAGVVVTQLATIPNWLGIIVIAGIAAIVLAYFAGVFRTQR